MEVKENDPDSLQILDELDEEWVELWKKATHKRKDELTMLVSSPEETKQVISKNKR